MSFKIHIGNNNPTLDAFGGLLANNTTTPSSGQVLMFVDGMWQSASLAPSEGMPTQRAPLFSINQHYSSPINQNITPYINSSYVGGEKEGNNLPSFSPFSKEDFVSILGEEQTEKLYSILNNIFLDDLINIPLVVKDDKGGLKIGADVGKYSTGIKNTLIGDGVCSANQNEGSFNTYVGTEAGLNNNKGDGNTGVGVVSGANITSGSWNSLFGQSSGNFITTGSGNTVIGSNAGLTLVNGNDNIVIGDGADVSNTEASSQIVFGKGVVGYGNNTITFPKNLTPFPSGTEVNFSSSGGGCLYPVSSSLRWKTDIKDISSTIDTTKLYDLRPITYKTKIGHGDTSATHVGLVAEEVNKLFPWIVPKDDDGQPSSVRYSLVPILILEEMKKLKEKVDILFLKENILSEKEHK